MAIPVPASELFGTMMETLGLGVYLVVFPRCINVLRQKEIKAGLLGYLLLTAIISLLLIFAHWVIDLARAFSAFTNNMSVANSPEKYFANVDTSLNIAKTACYVAVTLLADAMLNMEDSTQCQHVSKPWNSAA
ncbi:hypothetical protein HWV62_8901 [Athelia sp. TMB]|nr:hypothetical protein HWV62_8901 [Athelia sp. TMB]